MPYNKSLERDLFSVTRFALHSTKAPQLRRYTSLESDS